MAFTVVQAGSSLQAISPSGTIQTLTLPSGVTIDETIKGQFHTLNRQLLFTGAPSQNLWIDPITFTVRPMVLQTPNAAPTLTAAGTGLTGGYRAAYSYGLIDANGRLIQESSLSPVTDQISLTNQGLNWTAIQVSPDSSVNCRILYRSLAEGDADSLFPVATIYDNATTSFLGDATPDDALGGLVAATYLLPPAGTVPGTRAALAVVHQNRMFIIDANDPDSLVWSNAQSFTAFSIDNGARLTGDGEDQYGGQGFLSRREELVILKRSRVIRFVGSSNDDFEMMPDDSSQNVGCLAPRSALVIDNIGYFLASDGVYVVDSDGVRSITLGVVDPWFKSDLYFNRSGFYLAEAGYNPDTHAYELHLTAVGTAVGTLDRWIAFDIKKGVWFGPHLTSAFTPVSRGLVISSAGLKLAAVGASDGYVYLMNQTTKSDVAGASGSAVGIAVDWIHSFFHGDSPDFYHYWAMPTFHYQNESSSNTVALSWYVGELVGSTFPLSDTLPLNVDRKRSKRLGAGRLMRMRFQHSTAGENFLLRGVQVYYNTVGRR